MMPTPQAPAATPIPNPTPNQSSGIAGKVLIGPQCPVVRPDEEERCKDKLYQATIAVKTIDGSREITRFTSDSNGEFRVPLPPGSYLLEPLSEVSRFPRGKPQVVSVQPGEFTEVTILFDTGIR